MNNNLENILEWKYPQLKNGVDYKIVQHSEKEGCKIEDWKAIEPEPTVEEVMKLEPEWLGWKKSIAYKELRRNAILDEWPVHEQLEAITELEMGLPEKLKELLEHIKKVK